MNNEPIICKKCAHRQFEGTHCDFCGNLLIERRKGERRLTKFAWARILGFAVILFAAFGYFTFFHHAPPPTPIDPEPVTLFPAQGSGVLNKVMKTATDANDSDKPTGEQIFAKAAPGIVTIFQDDDAGKHQRVIGAGFLLDDTTIATNYHVVHGVTAVSAQFNDDSFHKVTLFLGSNQQHDVALLHIDKVQASAKDAAVDSLEAASKQVNAAGMSTSATSAPQRTALDGLRMGRTAALNVGDTVIAAGSPKGLGGSLAQGIVIAMPGGLLKTNLPVKEAWSGGPLLDMQGEVVGILTSQPPNEASGNFALPIEWATALQPSGDSSSPSAPAAPGSAQNSHNFGPYSFKLAAAQKRTIAFTTPADLESAQFSARLTVPATSHLHVTISRQGHILYDSGDNAGAHFTLSLKRGDYVMLIENSSKTAASDVSIAGTFSNDN